jgi:hypothetical protein
VVLLWENGTVVGTPGELRDSPQKQIAEFFNEEVSEDLVREPQYLPVMRW